MGNSSDVTAILLSAYYGMEELKHIYFCMFFILYLVIIVENVGLIGVIYLEKSLHQPMYFLVSNLAANGIYGSTALLPALLGHILSSTYEVSLPLCQTQTYTLHTYAIIEFTILAVMSYDRYVAICYPLQYHTIMSLNKVYALIVFTWLYPLVAFLIFFISVQVQLNLCQQTIDKLYCLNYLLVRLSCSDTFIINIVGLLSVVVLTFPQLAMVIYSYVHILRICLLSSRESKIKAIRTCTPHLFAVINYSVGCFFEILQSRFNTSNFPYITQMFMSLYFLIFPPILNAIMYGVSIQAIRVSLLKLFRNHKSRLLPKEYISLVH